MLTSLYEYIEWRRLGLWLVLIAAVGYIAAEPSWKSGSAVLAASFAVVAWEFTEFRRRVQSHAERPQVREHDQKLFRELMELLPSDGVIAFIDQHNMAGFSFDLEEVKPIDQFLATWNNPQHEFVDVDAEHARHQLIQACLDLSRTVAIETFQTNSGRQSVPAEWEMTQPDRFERVVKLLHDQAQVIVDTHNRLIRIGTRRLLP